jgi:hypothetical protein
MWCLGPSAAVGRPKLQEYTATREELDRRSRDIFHWIGSGRLKVAVDKVFSLEDAIAGHQCVAATGLALVEMVVVVVVVAAQLATEAGRAAVSAGDGLSSLVLGTHKLTHLRVRARCADAGRYLESGATRGKVVYKI